MMLINTAALHAEKNEWVLSVPSRDELVVLGLLRGPQQSAIKMKVL